MAKKKRSRSSSRSALGCLFWASLIVALVVAAIAAREPLQKALGKLFAGGPAPIPTVIVKPLSQKEPDSAQKDKPPEIDAKKPVNPENATVAEQSTATNTQPEDTPAVRKTRLFFASVDQNGKVALKSAIRPIPVSDSPLRDTILTLLKGPTSQEMNLGMLTMIPADSRLLGVTLHGDTAYVDFSESFRFNTLGTEGLNAQLRQVVYAATEYPTVKKVQFLIEGKKVQYLGSEGIRIDSPLGRQSFQD
jgi:spore germination protein GerM